MCVQNGEVFMFTGMLEAISDMHQLAIILGHEMSHALIEHAVSECAWRGLGGVGGLLLEGLGWEGVRWECSGGEGVGGEGGGGGGVCGVGVGRVRKG